MKRIGKMLVFLLLAGSLCACSEEDEVTEVTVRSYDETVHGAKEYKMENDDLVFELDPATTYFTVTQKSTGKVWYSNPTDGATDPNADSAGKKNLQSTLIIEYNTENGVNTLLNNYEFSISNGLYELETVEDGNGNIEEVRVLYTVGKGTKTYYMPLAVPESRMMEFYNNMERSQQKKIDTYYRRIDINNLFATDNKDELLETYPDLANERVYVIREGTKEYLMRQIEEIFASVGYTTEDYKVDKERYDISSDSDKAIINLTVVYRLEDNQLVVELPHDEIVYKSQYPLTKVSLLPYFGAGSITDEGYLFVPEGSGAIINFNNGKSEQSAYYADVYGRDDDQKKTELVDETRVAIPVFGIANGDSSFVAIMEEYSSIGTIQADVSGRRHSYNSAYATYEIIHGDTMDISAKSDRTIMAFEKNVPEGSTIQSYTFIEGTSYVDMAEVYRDYLQEKYPELQKVEETDMPVAVELIGAIDRIKQILGMPIKRPEVLTSFEDAKTILEEMVADGYENLSVRYSGWMNGGLQHSLPKDIDLTSGMGGKKALKALMEYANSNNVDVYLNGHVQHEYDSNIFDGFIRSRDAAKYISREVTELTGYSNIHFGELTTDRQETYHLLRPSVCVELMNNLAEAAADYNAGVAFEDVGYLLSADYNPRRTVTREESMDMQTEALAGIKASGTPIMISAGNEYALAYADIVTNVDLEGKDYQILDYKVPFYEIALHGLINYTGDAINLADNAQDLVLKSAETGAGLSFVFMSEEADILQNTEYMEFFGAAYDQWKDTAKDYYLRYKEEMAGLNNQFITDHEVLVTGVTATTYEDGTVVYVNYNTTDYEDESGTLTVPARDYLVERSGN